MHFKHLTKAQKIGVAIALGMLLLAGLASLVARPVSGVNNEDIVTMRALEFGERLKEVSLLQTGPEYELMIERVYGDFLTPELLAVWQTYPDRALGRMTSSPWPDRIEIGTVTKNFDESYSVLGSVVEVANGVEGPVAIYPVSLTFVERDGQWYIEDVTKGTYIAVPERRTVEGTYVCLPHKDTAGPQTMECAFGLETEDGIFYALDFNILRSSDIMSNLITGQRVRIEGTFVPVEHLSTSIWSRYAIEGIVRVTALEEL